LTIKEILNQFDKSIERIEHDKDFADQLFREIYTKDGKLRKKFR